MERGSLSVRLKTRLARPHGSLTCTRSVNIPSQRRPSVLTIRAVDFPLSCPLFSPPHSLSLPLYNPIARSIFFFFREDSLLKEGKMNMNPEQRHLLTSLSTSSIPPSVLAGAPRSSLRQHISMETRVPPPPVDSKHAIHFT